jgi:hypothetical protein
MKEINTLAFFIWRLPELQARPFIKELALAK